MRRVVLSAFDILYQSIVQPTIRPLAALISRLIDKPSNDSECNVRAFAIFGQILIFRTARSATLKGLGWEKFTEERIELIRTVVQQHATGSVKELGNVEHTSMPASEKPNIHDQTAAKNRKKSYRHNRNLPKQT